MNSMLLFLSACFATGIALPTATLPTFVEMTTPGKCYYNGRMYALGSFRPSACEHCQCTHTGKAYCAIADCFITPCVDAVHDPDKCCPVCPNGENCMAPDGKVIKKGEIYHPDQYTTCQCAHSFALGHNALCAVKEQAPVTVNFKPR